MALHAGARRKAGGVEKGRGKIDQLDEAGDAATGGDVGGGPTENQRDVPPYLLLEPRAASHNGECPLISFRNGECPLISFYLLPISFQTRT
jgi:hypothetical protein